MEFSRQEYWGGLLFLSPGDLSHPGIEPGSLALQADFLPSELSGKPLDHEKEQPINIILTVTLFFPSFIHPYPGTSSFIITFII